MVKPFIEGHIAINTHASRKAFILSFISIAVVFKIGPLRSVVLSWCGRAEVLLHRRSFNLSYASILPH